MNIGKLKQAIANLPDDMEVFIGERLTEEAYGLVNSVREQTITVGDDEDADIYAQMRVFVLTED
jgi:hypothetical protein